MSARAVDKKRLLELLNAEKAFADEFLALALAQADFLAADNLGAYNDALDQRQVLMGQIDGLEAELAQLPRAGDGLDPDADELRRAIRAVFRQIQKADEANRETLGRQMAQLSAEIEKLSQHREGLSGYGQGAPFAASEFFDKKL